MPLELVIFVRLQAAGKSTCFRTHLAATHVHGSKDLMKNARKLRPPQSEEGFDEVRAIAPFTAS